MSIDPDTKDWTWVLTRPCDECGFDAPALTRDRLPEAIRDNATLWEVVLGTDDAAVRPSPHVWSPLEYACHVRDVNRLFAQRLRLMLGEDNPTFANWDQDQTARRRRLRLAGARRGRRRGRRRPPTRSPRPTRPWPATSGSAPARAATATRFTVDTLARYHLHDLVHHAHDVSHITKRVTVASYDAFAEAYRDGTAECLRRRSARPSTGSWRRCPRARGCWRSAAAPAGTPARWRPPASPSAAPTSPRPSSRCCAPTATTPTWSTRSRTTSPTPARDEAYDGVWAAASLLHVRREDFPLVVRRLAEVTRPRRGAPPRAEGGRRRALLHPRQRRRPAPLHVLARAAAARRARRRPAGRSPRSTAGVGMRGEHWLDVLARRTDEAHRVLGADGAGARPGVRPVLGRPVRHRPSSAAAPRAEALEAGVPPKEVWRAVWAALELPPVDR